MTNPNSGRTAAICAEGGVTELIHDTTSLEVRVAPPQSAQLRRAEHHLEHLLSAEVIGVVEGLTTCDADKQRFVYEHLMDKYRIGIMAILCLICIEPTNS